MGRAFQLALSDTFAPAGRRALLMSVGSTVVLLIVLWLGASALIPVFHVSRFHWLNTAIDVAGSLATLAVAWILFPALSMLVLGFFFDRFVSASERLHYPDLPPARQVGMIEILRSALWLAVISVILNLVLLPLYFLPVINLPIYYGLNGYLVARAYFEPIALRRMDLQAARNLWHRHRGYLSIAGVIITVLLSLPLINFIAPLIGVALLFHLFQGLRRDAPAL